MGSSPLVIDGEIGDVNGQEDEEEEKEEKEVEYLVIRYGRVCSLSTASGHVNAAKDILAVVRYYKDKL